MLVTSMVNGKWEDRQEKDHSTLKFSVNLGINTTHVVLRWYMRIYLEMSQYLLFMNVHCIMDMGKCTGGFLFCPHSLRVFLSVPVEQFIPGYKSRQQGTIAVMIRPYLLNSYQAGKKHLTRTLVATPLKGSSLGRHYSFYSLQRCGGEAMLRTLMSAPPLMAQP